MLKPLGELGPNESLDRVQAIAARRVLEQMARPGLLLEGFVPVFPGGSLREGSPRREGTQYIREKGRGLLWSAVLMNLPERRSGKTRGRAAGWVGAPRGRASAGCNVRTGRPSACWWGGAS